MISAESIRVVVHVVDENLDIQYLASDACKRIDVERIGKDEPHWLSDVFCVNHFYNYRRPEIQQRSRLKYAILHAVK